MELSPLSETSYLRFIASPTVDSDRALLPVLEGGYVHREQGADNRRHRRTGARAALGPERSWLQRLLSIDAWPPNFVASLGRSAQPLYLGQRYVDLGNRHCSVVERDINALPFVAGTFEIVDFTPVAIEFRLIG